MLNKLKIWLHERKEKRLYLEELRVNENERHEKMIEEAEHLASRPASTIANAPAVKISVKKAA